MTKINVIDFPNLQNLAKNCADNPVYHTTDTHTGTQKQVISDVFGGS